LQFQPQEAQQSEYSSSLPGLSHAMGHISREVPTQATYFSPLKNVDEN
jgi:hypothetical protein